MFANLIGAVIVAILIGRNEDLRTAANVRFWPKQTCRKTQSMSLLGVKRT
jgi:hypothetical protein